MLPSQGQNPPIFHMTVDEFIKGVEELKKHYPNIGEYSMTIHKKDKNQLSCSTTVPIERLDVGFDWTMNQVVLEPSLKLTTHPDETHDKLVEKLSWCSKERLNHISLAAQMSKMLGEIQDEDLRNRFHDILKQF